jgi:aryl-alcohol dehydrogenase-like predicted oxidoreductase
MGGVSTTIVGMKTSQHVRKNLEVAVNPPLSEEEFLSVFVPPTKRTEQP